MKVIKKEDGCYPYLLRLIENAPEKLYVEGDVSNLNTNCIAVVGSRSCTEYGKKWCEFFVRELVKYDLTIVSGMAVGIDRIAHETAMECGGKTIAVLPCGLKKIYPEENRDLYKNILLSGGSVMTEYGLEEVADSNKFLERNRIVSGLSLATLVVEAATRSGTSVTAQIANSQNRNVFCIPRKFG